MNTIIADTVLLDDALSRNRDPLASFRSVLQTGNEHLRERFSGGEPVAELVRDRALLIDAVLLRAWDQLMPHSNGIALVAVGGYGRGELHPASDIDLMILLGDEAQARHTSEIESFITFLWDIGLEVGHSVRTLSDCRQQAALDITVVTNLMESRLLAGSQALFDAMREETGPQHIWPSTEFFEAKYSEQRRRHRKYDDTAYTLEPNVKEGPGGLRDIQMIGWVAKRHFGTSSLHDLVELDFLTEAEYDALRNGQNFLWKVRFALHVLNGRSEDRLLFDYQRTIATQFGFVDSEHSLAVEQFMQSYYQTVIELGRLNEMLLQLFQEAILYDGATEAPVAIDEHFQARNGFIEVIDETVFDRYPFALLEIFLRLQQHPELKGVRATTIRLIRANRHLMDDRFRNDRRARSIFMEIVRQHSGLTHELRRMNRYGVLAAYIPAFDHIVGRMQYDLYHVYTVDEHSLFTVRNLRRYALPKHSHEFPLCSRIFKKLPKPELLYLAGLFHDIGKGRGGDHSALGAEVAEQFCLKHDLRQVDAHLVSWLVRNHLLMSMTAQRKDISDPDVVFSFASDVGTATRLDYLYLLTVADIRATNPKMWNSWKDALLRELYLATRRALERGLAEPLLQQELTEEIRTQAEELLAPFALSRKAMYGLWHELGEEYFLQNSAADVAWHTRAILRLPRPRLPLVLVRKSARQGGTEVFLYSKESERLFVIATTILDQCGLTIVSARILTMPSGHTLHSYHVLEEDGRPVAERSREMEIRSALISGLKQPSQVPSQITRRVPRQLRHFATATEIVFTPDPGNERTIVKLITGDRPGLLSQVGKAFEYCRVRLHHAKIATIGAQTEDVFFITDGAGRPIEDPGQLECIRDTLSEKLESGLRKP